MAKRKSLLAVLLLAVLAFGCALFAACGGGTKYEVKWTYDSEHLTVTAEGYETLPTELKEGEEVIFTVTPAKGWGVKNVTPSSLVKKEGSNYKLTMRASNAEIKINAEELIDHLEVTEKPLEVKYNAGETVKKDDYKITVFYKTDRSVELSSDEWQVQYQNEEEGTFALGDTKFTITYNGATAEVELDETVIGKITLNLYGGTIADKDLEAFKNYPDYNFDRTKGEITWTFDEPLTEAIVLPTPTKPIPGADEGEFPFLRWSGEGVNNGKIAVGTKVSVTATATYDNRFVQLNSIELTTKTVQEEVGGEETGGEESAQATVEVEVPYLIIKGEFKAANSAYLYLYEGNDPPVFLNGPTITKVGDDANFTCEFDLRNLAAKTAYEGKWMDIKFCAQICGRLETQEIDLNQYDKNFIVGDRMIFTPQGGESTAYWQFAYNYVTPKPGDEIKGTPGATYTGKENLLKIYFQKLETLPDYVLGTMKLEERDGKPYLIIPGQCAKIDKKEDAEEKLANYLKDLQNFSNWAPQEITQTLTVNEDLSFEVAVCLENVTETGNYVGHVTNNLPGAGDSNFNYKGFDDTPIKVNGIIYQIVDVVTGWGWNWSGIHVENTTIFGVNGNSVSADENGAYLNLTGYAGELTEEQIKEKLTQLDFENKDNASDKTIIDPEKITVTIEDGVWTLKADISELKAGYYWVHAVGLIDGNGDISFNASMTPAEFGDKTFSAESIKMDWGNATLFKVEGGSETPEVTE